MSSMTPHNDRAISATPQPMQMPRVMMIVASMASAGPRAQAELLKGLGISTTLITDGHTPLNLYNTARGLMGNTGDGQSQ